MSDYQRGFDNGYKKATNDLEPRNSELHKALSAMYKHFAIDDEDNDLWHPRAVRACKMARVALSNKDFGSL